MILGVEKGKMGASHSIGNLWIVWGPIETPSQVLYLMSYWCIILLYWNRIIFLCLCKYHLFFPSGYQPPLCDRVFSRICSCTISSRSLLPWILISNGEKENRTFNNRPINGKLILKITKLKKMKQCCDKDWQDGTKGSFTVKLIKLKLKDPSITKTLSQSLESSTSVFTWSYLPK